jgi:hypothetical protein
MSANSSFASDSINPACDDGGYDGGYHGLLKTS